MDAGRQVGRLRSVEEGGDVVTQPFETADVPRPLRERRQLERTARVRAERDGEAAGRALEEVRRVARTDENLLGPMREALRLRCTVGEICEVLREEFGTYDAQRA